jgi:MFS family permease
LGWGGVIPVRPALQAEVFGIRAFGAIQGLIFTVATVGALIGPVFAGWMYDQTDSYRLAFVLVAAGGLLAAPMILTLRRPAARAAPGPA